MLSNSTLEHPDTLAKLLDRDYASEIHALPQDVADEAVRHTRYNRLTMVEFTWNLAFSNEWAKFPLTV